MDDVATTLEDTPVTINVLGNDTDGPDGFSYRASDGTDQSDVANVLINITSVNDAPRMIDPSQTNFGPVHPYENIRVDILSLYAPGPSDESGQTMELLLDPYVSTPYGVGGQPVDAPGTISYIAFSVPASGYDSFAYTVIDDAGGVTSTDFHVDIT